MATALGNMAKSTAPALSDTSTGSKDSADDIMHSTKDGSAAKEEKPQAASQESKQDDDPIVNSKETTAAEEKTHAEQHFLIFQRLFMIGFMIHCRKYDDIFFILTIGQTAAHVVLPCPDVVFFTYLITILACFLDYTPNGANHLNVVALASLVLLPYQLCRVLKCVGVLRSCSKVQQETLACLRYLIIGIYFMAGFHKMNREFLFEPTVTCALKKLGGYLKPLLGADFQEELPPWIGLTLAPGVIVLEMVPPLLLLYPRYRRLALLLLIKLHTILLPMGFADFGSIAQSFLWTFVSPTLVTDAALSSLFVSSMTMIFVAFESMVYMGRLNHRHFDRNFYKQHEALLVFIVYGCLWYKIYQTRERKPIQVQAPRSAWSWLFLSFFAFFVMNPYLGLRTAGNLTMFSNLRTDGATSNHILLGSNPLKFFDMQEDTVELIDCDPRFDDPKHMVPGNKIQRLMFDRILLDEAYVADDYPRVYLKIAYQGQVLKTEDLNNDPAFDKFRLDNEPWWSSMYFNFRSLPVSKEPSECKW